MAVIVQPGAQVTSMAPTTAQVLDALRGNLTLGDVADDPYGARYAVSAVDAANMPLLAGVQPVPGMPWPSSAGVTQFNGLSGAIAVSQLVGTGPTFSVGVSTPGSGIQVGDVRNLPVTGTMGVTSVLSTSPISFSISGTTVNFSVGAFSVYNQGLLINYNAAAGSVSQAAGTTQTYYLYFDDPTYAGGSQALGITTAIQAMAQTSGYVNIGSAEVTVSSGGGGSGGTGSGGGGWCVADEMFIGEGRRAGAAVVGDPFDCIDLPTAAGKHVRALQGVSHGVEGCVRMITNDGCALVCSVSTPFDLPDGRNTTAPRMLGEQVVTDLGTATVISLALVGPRSVTRAHLGGVSYAAGADPHRRIYSHNPTASKP